MSTDAGTVPRLGIPLVPSRPRLVMLIPGFLAGDQSLTRMAVSLRAVIVGQSRGGSIARAIAVLRQDLVKTVVTLGAPLLDQLAIRARTWPSVLGVGLLGTSGVPAC